ncbi:hypothetical protein Q9L58_002245 [Maublancomyces gigas]|uniref:Rhodopsin domain-containing protein n=1 Tax=Discina gigas TaxID=1032678 RepID=A0ABR3GSG6_9PEZI
MFLNFDNNGSIDIAPPSRAHFVLGVASSAYIVALTFVSARVLVKAKLGKFGLEDVLICISAFLGLATLVWTSIACKYGFGIHTVDVLPEWILPFGVLNYSTIAICTVCFYCTKTSMLVFYLRLATERPFRIVIYISITYLTLSFGIVTFIHVFSCSPISGAWDRRPSMKSICITTMLDYHFAAVNVLMTDILMIVLPIPIVLRLRMKWLAKLGLMAMFSMGFLITAVSIVSVWIMHVSVIGKDILWDGAYSWMLTLVEMYVGIMTACMPAMNMFIKWIRGEKSVPAEPENDTIGGGG